ncbi:hypothetical protein [Snuella lapsa]|uniref:DUF4595 domain-containing protein n=1 Tax=Snuella lapsa TaxID=870481 RepID=A0ABP6YH11_9FLAO
MNLKQFLLVTLFISVLACSSESDDSKETPNDGILIEKIIYDKGTEDEYTETFIYDGNKLMSVDYGDDYKNVYTYDDNDNLIKDDAYAENELMATIAIEYNSENKVASYTETFHDGSGLEGIYKYELSYNNDATITVKVYNKTSSSDFELYNTETITLNGKNIVKIVHDDGYTESYTYDNKNSAFKNIHAIEVLNLLSHHEYGAEIYSNTHNIISFVESGDSISDNYNDIYEYTYNENNYPKTGIATYSYGNLENEVSTIEFVYK